MAGGRPVTTTALAAPTRDTATIFTTAKSAATLATPTTATASRASSSVDIPSTASPTPTDERHVLCQPEFS